MEKKEGRLFYNTAIERMDVLYDDGTTEDGLHCGQTMDVNINGKWIPTRIEKSDVWYLVGIKNISFHGLFVRL